MTSFDMKNESLIFIRVLMKNKHFGILKPYYKIYKLDICV